MEVWKDVKGYEGLYQVSNIGRVYSLPKEWIVGNGVRRRHDGIIMRHTISRVGYKMVILVKDGKQKNRSIHQMVAESFLNHVSCGYKMVVDHINNDKLDNRVENLRIVTQRSNSSRRSSEKSSKYVGVHFYKQTGKWRAQIVINKKKHHIGYYESELDAYNAYKQKIKEIEK